MGTLIILAPRDCWRWGLLVATLLFVSIFVTVPLRRSWTRTSEFTSKCVIPGAKGLALMTSSTSPLRMSTRQSLIINSNDSNDSNRWMELDLPFWSIDPFCSFESCTAPVLWGTPRTTIHVEPEQFQAGCVKSPCSPWMPLMLLAILSQYQQLVSACKCHARAAILQTSSNNDTWMTNRQKSSRILWQMVVSGRHRSSPVVTPSKAHRRSRSTHHLPARSSLRSEAAPRRLCLDASLGYPWLLTLASCFPPCRICNWSAIDLGFICDLSAIYLWFLRYCGYCGVANQYESIQTTLTFVSFVSSWAILTILWCRPLSPACCWCFRFWTQSFLKLQIHNNQRCASPVYWVYSPSLSCHVLSMSCPCLYPLHPSPAFFMSLDVSGKMWVAMWQLGSLGCVTRRYCEITGICGTSMCIVQMQPGFAASRRASRRHHGTELRSGNLPGSISPQNETAKLAQPGTTWHTPWCNQSIHVHPLSLSAIVCLSSFNGAFCPFVVIGSRQLSNFNLSKWTK